MWNRFFMYLNSMLCSMFVMLFRVIIIAVQPQISDKMLFFLLSSICLFFGLYFAVYCVSVCLFCPF